MAERINSNAHDNYELTLYYALPTALELLEWLKRGERYQERNPLPGLVCAHETFHASSHTAATACARMRSEQLGAVHFNVNACGNRGFDLWLKRRGVFRSET